MKANSTEQLDRSSTEVDARLYMAAERTFLAWIRTGIALMGFGFVVARFGLFLREIALSDVHKSATQHDVPNSRLSLPIGVGLIVLGIVVNAVSVLRHHRYVAALDRNQFRSAFGSKFVTAVAIALCLCGLAMAIFLLGL